MIKPNISNFVQMPLSTNTGINVNYRAYSLALEQYIEYLEGKVKLGLFGVTNRTFKCERCGTLYQITEGEHIPCCTMYAEHRTSDICGGGLFEIIE